MRRSDLVLIKSLFLHANFNKLLFDKFKDNLFVLVFKVLIAVQFISGYL